MPINLRDKHTVGDMLYQREVYAKSRITRAYWNYRDQQVLKFIHLKHSSIVDIGCGEGITLEKIIKIFPDRNALGVDFSKENIEICKRNNLPVIHSDVYDLQLESNSIDCCLLLDVIEHLDRPEKAIEEMFRILRKSGRAVIVFPNDRTFKIVRILAGKLKEAFYDYGHVKQWIPRELAGMLEGNGLHVIAQKNIPFVFWHLSLHNIMIAEKY